MCVMIDVDKVIEDFNGRINKAHSLAEKRFSENMRDAVVTFLLEMGVQFDKETGEIL